MVRFEWSIIYYMSIIIFSKQLFLRALFKSYRHRLISRDFYSSEFCIDLVHPRCVFARQDVILYQDVGDENLYRDKCPAYCRACARADSKAEPVIVLERVWLVIVETVRVKNVRVRVVVRVALHCFWQEKYRTAFIHLKMFSSGRKYDCTLTPAISQSSSASLKKNRNVK